MSSRHEIPTYQKEDLPQLFVTDEEGFISHNAPASSTCRQCNCPLRDTHGRRPIMGKWLGYPFHHTCLSLYERTTTTSQSD